MSLPGFGVRKPVPVNLLMIATLLGGLVLGLELRREFFPEVTPEQAVITLPYPGASPEEIEDTLAIKVEDQLVADIEEIDEIRTTISEGGGGIIVEFREGTDVRRVMDDVEQSIDSLIDLPEESERITTRLLEPRLPVIRLSLFGDLDEDVLKRAVKGIRDDLRTLPGMGEIVIEGVRDYEIRIDVNREAMLKHGISLPQIADAIGAWMRDIPGGTVRTSTGNTKVRTMGVPEEAAAIREIVVTADPQGRAVRVRDIAQVREAFVDEQVINRFDGQPAANLTVFKVGDQDIVNMAEMVRAYAAGRQNEPFAPRLSERVFGSDRIDAWRLGRRSARPLPAGAQVALATDLARFVEGRLELLLRNAIAGALLVFATLLVFLNWRAALWVGVGLTTAIAGTIVLMFAFDITLNLLTMFGLIIVLGLLVDDAIVVAENIQTGYDQGKPALVAAVEGTNHVFWPVVATVMTTIVAFLPLTFIRGQIGDLLGALPFVVACALFMSLVEAVLILPSHMGHSLARRDRLESTPFSDRIRRVERWRDRLIYDRAIPVYVRALEACLRFRYVTIAATVAAVIVSLGMVQSGWVPFTFLPDSDSETVVVNVQMPIGSPIDHTERIVSHIESVAAAQPETKSVSSQIGQATNIETSEAEAYAPHVAQMFIELHPVEQRDRESAQVIDAIRESMAGRVDAADRITFSEISGGPAGPDISLRVRGDDLDALHQASQDLQQMMAQFDGVHDIADDEDLGQLELRVNLRPDAAAAGFSNADVARQVRGFLYGLDAHTFARQQEDIDVRVRLDEQTRRSLYGIEHIWLISPQGDPVPLAEVADIDNAETYAVIRRFNRQRAVTITAETIDALSPEDVVSRMIAPRTETRYRFGILPSQQVVGPSPLDDIRQKYPGLTFEFAGRQKQLRDAFGSLPLGFAAAVLSVYVILAWLFSSYLQPIIVLTAVPFSIVGVVWGHLLLGYDLTFLSLIGFVGLSGIVVNDSLILVEFFNEKRREGLSVHDALISAGKARFRAILLTTLTTVLGLTPLILEQSFQAQFLIPMAIAVAAGLLSATVLILVVLPCFIAVFSDLRQIGWFLWYGETQTLHPMSHSPDLPDA